MDIKICEINLFQGNCYMMPGFFALSLIFADSNRKNYFSERGACATGQRS